VANSLLKELVDTVREMRAEQVRQGAEQVRQNVIVERHEQRSLQLEERVLPIERHVAMWSGVGKALTVLGVLAGIVASVAKVLGAF
jgi:hypothetical protein